MSGLDGARPRARRAATDRARGPGRARARRAISRRTLLASALTVAGAFGLGGCRLAVPAPPAATPTTGPALSPSEFPVGVVLSLSGRFSREGALLRAGYETWAAAVEQAGGIKLGAGRRPVRLVLADDEGEPLVAGRQVERLAANDRLRLFLGPFTAALTTAVATAAERVGALVVAPDASAAALYRRGLKNVVSILAPDDRLFHGLADLAASVQPRAQPVGILIADEPSSSAAAAGFRERAAALDLAPIRLELMALGSRDVSPPLERIAETAPRCVIVAAEPGQTARFAPTVRDLLPDVAMRALVPLPEPPDASGRRATLYDGVLTVETWSPSISAAGPVLGTARDFADRFRRLHGYQPEARAAAAAAAGLALQLAVERAGAADPAPVREAFTTLDLATFWGHLAWDMAGRNRVTVAPVLQQQGDALVAVYPPDLAGGRLRHPLAGWPRP
jgi:branched-chain amino acid transport system substrate-binding protein